MSKKIYFLDVEKIGDKKEFAKAYNLKPQALTRYINYGITEQTLEYRKIPKKFLRTDKVKEN